MVDIFLYPFYLFELIHILEVTDVKKDSEITAMENVLRIIKRYRKGVTTSTLKQKTGFEKKKIHNIVYKLKKQGKIKSEEKGKYVKA
jgi:DNA replicative helicase MCM subunit Mcm2 (Cdc46/Mcm family)